MNKVLGYISSLRDGFLGKMLLTAVFVAVGLFAYNQALAAAIVITPATGGGSVSIDKTSAAGGTGAWTTLTNPKLVEGAVNDIKSGAQVFTLPAGWEINTASSVAVSVTGAGTTLAIAGTTATTTANTFMFIVTATSTAAATGTVTFSGIQVRPTGTATSTGNITYATSSSAGITGVTDSTNFGTLATVVGTATQLVWVTQPATSVLSTATWTLFTIKIADQFGNASSTATNSVTVAPTFGSFGGTTATTSVAGLASFNNISKTVTGTTTVFATATDLATSSQSSVITINPGAAQTVTISTQPGGTGVITDALAVQPIIHVVDTYGNDVANGVTVTASLISGSGSLSNTTANTAGGAGLATFTSLGYSVSGEVFTIKFTANGHDSATSVSVGPLNAGSSGSSGGGGAYASIPAPTASFSANYSTITLGQSATLTWSTTNATAVSINQGIGAVNSSGTKVITPTSTTAYILTATGSGGTVTQTVTVAVGLTAVPVTPPSGLQAPGSAFAGAHAPGSAILTPDGTVWFVMPDNTLRAFTSGGAFLSYGYLSFGQVVSANSVDLTMPQGSFIPPMDGKIVCSDRDDSYAVKGTCYLITGGKRAAFTSAAVFTALGFKFNHTTNGDVSFLATDANISDAALAHRPGVLVNNNGTVQLVGQNSLMGIPTMSVLESWGYTLADVVPANAADKAIVQSGVMPARVVGQLSP